MRVLINPPLFQIIEDYFKKQYDARKRQNLEKALSRKKR